MVILVRVEAGVRQKIDPRLIRCTSAEGHETVGHDSFGNCLNYLRIDMRAKLCGGQSPNGLRRAERFARVAVDGKRDWNTHQT
jgi:hypothetical protein